MFVFFFFQAEDGIRDYKVTGVQTCALPILTGGLVTGPERNETAFGFRVVQGRIEIAFDCPPGADCVAPPHIVARPTPNGLEVQYALGARVPQIFARLASPF